MSCGRIRKEQKPGIHWLLQEEMDRLKVAQIKLARGESCVLPTEGLEFAGVLVSGHCRLQTESSFAAVLGPRQNPVTEKAFGFILTRNETATFTALEDTLIAMGAAEAAVKKENQLVTPEMNGGGNRGADNWSRKVRFVVWNDNTDANMVMAGETIVESGNWATMPPHRHQYDISGEEVPYDEAYLYFFSEPQGFGLARLFDEEMDEAYSLKDNDLLYMDRGYHPVVCAPGSTMYQVTLMAGPKRQSAASLHPDYRYLLQQQKLENPYQKQSSKK